MLIFPNILWFLTKGLYTNFKHPNRKVRMTTSFNYITYFVNVFKIGPKHTGCLNTSLIIHGFLSVHEDVAYIGVIGVPFCSRGFC